MQQVSEASWSKGEYLTLIGKLKQGSSLSNELGLSLNETRALYGSFDFIARSYFKQESDWQVHSLAQLQPFEVAERLWIEESPD